MDLIPELLAGMRSYTGNADLDSRTSYKYFAIRQRSHRRRDGDLIVEMILQ